MTEEERFVLALRDALHSQPSAEVEVVGVGEYRQVLATNGARSCRVSGLGHDSLTQWAGAHEVTLHEGYRWIAGGWSSRLNEVVACVRAWCAGASLEDLETQLPFVGETSRKFRALAQEIRVRTGNGDLTDVVTSITGCTLRTDERERSCEVELAKEGFRCTFSFRQQPVARAYPLDDVAGAVASWVVERRPLRDLAREFPSVRIERHAEVLEAGEPTRWHWLRERDATGHPLLAPLRPLVELLIERGVATDFYSFTSHSWLCFSASSHYPWVDEGLPHVAADRHDRSYVVIPDGRAFNALSPEGTDQRWEELLATRCSCEEAAERIEALLRAAPVRPFFGSATTLAIEPLNDELRRQRSKLRAEHVGRHAILVTAGDRSCELAWDLRAMWLREGGVERATVRVADSAYAVAALRMWLEDRRDLQRIEADPHVRAFRAIT